MPKPPIMISPMKWRSVSRRRIPESMRPTRTARRRAGSSVSGRAKTIRPRLASDATPSTAKISRHPPQAITSEPVKGASIGDTEMTIMIAAIIFAASGPVAMSRITARGTTISVAAPSPCNARAAISQPIVGASAAAMVAARKITTPITSGRLRPTASDSGP